MSYINTKPISKFLKRSNFRSYCNERRVTVSSSAMSEIDFIINRFTEEILLLGSKNRFIKEKIHSADIQKNQVYLALEEIYLNFKKIKPEYFENKNIENGSTFTEEGK